MTNPFVPFPIVTPRYSDATIRTTSVFVQHEQDLSQALTLTLGGRYYDVKSDLDLYRISGVDQPVQTNSDQRFLGSVGLTYKPAEDVTWRASISQGYTYPSLAQLYLTTTGGGTTTVGNPDLKPESSTSYEIGARLDRGAITVDGTLFYTEAKDYIARGGGTYVNVDSVKSFGAELGVEYDSGVWGLRPTRTLRLSVANTPIPMVLRPMTAARPACRVLSVCAAIGRWAT